jgi:hypothetical protein
LSAHFGLHFGQKYRRKKPAQDVLLTDPDEIARGLLAGVVEWKCSDIDCFWIVPCTGTENQIEQYLESGSFRVKPGHTLPPKKTKKLVNREREDFWPLIGRYWAKDSAGRRYLTIDDTWHYRSIQEGWQIAPLGTEDWQPMQKEIEVE